MRHLVNFLIGFSVILLYPLLGLLAAGIEGWSVGGSFDWGMVAVGPLFFALLLIIAAILIVLIAHLGRMIRSQAHLRR